MPTTNEALLDSALRHEVDLRRYGNGVVRKIVALLNRVDDDLVEQIKAFDPDEVSGEWSRKRIERMLDEIRRINRDAYRLVDRELSAEMRALADYEAGFQVRALADAIPVQMNIVQPTTEQVYAATMARPFQGRLLKDWGKDLESSAFAKVRDAIRQGFVEGETVAQVVRRIRGTRARKYKDGILETTRRNAEAVVRTAISHTANMARAETYKSNADIVAKVQWVSTLDGRTTLICMSRDGKTYPVDSGPRPPAHFNCRSTTVPVTKSWREMGFDIDDLDPPTRASMNGQVPGKETYNSWLAKQPPEFQDDVLGDAKGRLYREGGLSVDRFVDRKGVEYTLEELREREPQAFQRAGL